MRTILIDPFARRVSEVDIPSKMTEEGDELDLDAIKVVIGCEFLDHVTLRIRDERLLLLVNDTGLFVKDQAFFLIQGVALAGKAIFIGSDEMGNTVAPSASVNDVAQGVQWVTRSFAEMSIRMGMQAAMAHAVAHDEHVQPIGEYGFFSTPSRAGADEA